MTVAGSERAGSVVFGELDLLHGTAGILIRLAACSGGTRRCVMSEATTTIDKSNSIRFGSIETPRAPQQIERATGADDPRQQPRGAMLCD